ncbi:MAG: hypothetical protein GX979_06370 [Firmicutes bacterium]|nr:hypothetical protein [Bacillota bacterium]
MKKQRLERLYEALEAEKQELLGVEERLAGPGGLGVPMDEATGELSIYDNHFADYASELYERSKDLGILENTRQQIAEIEEAQNAIAEGNYGYCHNCGQMIPESRLMALPRTLLCVQCKREQEDRDEHQRPVEEDDVFFAGEDAWGVGRDILPNEEFSQ